MIKKTTLIALAGLALLPLSNASYAKAVSNVSIGRADAVDASGEVCTAAPFFHDMPSMSETFTFGGTTSRQVIVLFQGAFGVFTEGSAAFVRLTIDGVPQSGPGDVIVDHTPSGEPTQRGTHGFNFISDLLAPGTHTVKIQWRDIGVGPACVFDRSLIVMHK